MSSDKGTVRDSTRFNVKRKSSVPSLPGTHASPRKEGEGDRYLRPGSQTLSCGTGRPPSRRTPPAVLPEDARGGTATRPAARRRGPAARGGPHTVPLFPSGRGSPGSLGCRSRRGGPDRPVRETKPLCKVELLVLSPHGSAAPWEARLRKPVSLPGRPTESMGPSIPAPRPRAVAQRQGLGRVCGRGAAGGGGARWTGPRGERSA